MNREVIYLAMDALKRGDITLADYNEIIELAIGMTKYTINSNVHNFFKDIEVSIVQLEIGWIIDADNNTTKESEEQ